MSTTEAPEGTRSVVALSLGARLSVVTGLLVAVLAGYVYFVPIQFQGGDGSLFRCGSAADPVSDTFARNVCGDRNAINRDRALALAAMALIVAVGGSAAFGLRHRQEHLAGRTAAPADDDPLS